MSAATCPKRTNPICIRNFARLSLCDDKIWAGAIMVSALALAANWLLQAAERLFDPAVRAGRVARRQQARRSAMEDAQLLQG